MGLEKKNFKLFFSISDLRVDRWKKKWCFFFKNDQISKKVPIFDQNSSFFAQNLCFFDIFQVFQYSWVIFYEMNGKKSEIRVKTRHFGQKMGIFEKKLKIEKNEENV